MILLVLLTLLACVAYGVHEREYSGFGCQPAGAIVDCYVTDSIVEKEHALVIRGSGTFTFELSTNGTETLSVRESSETASWRNLRIVGFKHIVIRGQPQELYANGSTKTPVKLLVVEGENIVMEASETITLEEVAVIGAKVTMAAKNIVAHMTSAAPSVRITADTIEVRAGAELSATGTVLADTWTAPAATTVAATTTAAGRRKRAAGAHAGIGGHHAGFGGFAYDEDTGTIYWPSTAIDGDAMLSRAGLGYGGFASDVGLSDGGAAGGLVVLEFNELIIDGTVSSDGVPAESGDSGAGSGSGGTVMLIGTTISGGGSVSCDGGATTGAGGAGGGGRVIVRHTNAFTVDLHAYGGAPDGKSATGGAGGHGTVTTVTTSGSKVMVRVSGPAANLTGVDNEAAVAGANAGTYWPVDAADAVDHVLKLLDDVSGTSLADDDIDDLVVEHALLLGNGAGVPQPATPTRRVLEQLSVEVSGRVELREGAVLRARAVDIVADTLQVDAGAYVNADASELRSKTGVPPGEAPSGYSGLGGGYGGNGAHSQYLADFVNYLVGGSAFGSAITVTSGAPGGRAASDVGGWAGGAAGGTVSLAIATNCTIAGTVSANGAPGLYDQDEVLTATTLYTGGSGSGGGVTISAPAIAGDGFVLALGGDSLGIACETDLVKVCDTGGAGGGGRIFFDDFAEASHPLDDGDVRVSVLGGSPGGGVQRGGAGTLYFRSAADVEELRIVGGTSLYLPITSDAGTPWPFGGSIAAPEVVDALVRNTFIAPVDGEVSVFLSGTLRLENALVRAPRVHVSASVSVSVDADSSISADGENQSIDDGDVGGVGDSSTTDLDELGAGGSYGGAGVGGGGAVFAGDVYGLAAMKTPTANGAAGGSYLHSGVNNKGGVGAGAVRVDVGETLQLNGVVTANGGSVKTSAAFGGPGAGSGGSVWVSAIAIAGDGGIYANGGGVLASKKGSPGGGGRVAVYFEEMGANITVGAYGGARADDDRVQAGAGTVWLSNTETRIDTLLIGNGRVDEEFVDGGPPTELPDLDLLRIVVSGGAEVWLPAGGSTPHELRVGEMVVEDGGRLSVQNAATGTLKLSAERIFVRGNYSLVYAQSIDLCTSELTVEENGHISADHLGDYCATCSCVCASGGEPDAGNEFTDGGGNGGRGANCGGEKGGARVVPNDLDSIGDVAFAYEFGSAGGALGGAPGALGGGRIRLTVSDLLTMNSGGTVSADGADGAAGKGAAGSGGGILVRAPAIVADGGVIRAKGGDGANKSGGGGGGGGVVLMRVSDSPPTGLSRAVGAGATNNSMCLYSEGDTGLIVVKALVLADLQCGVFCGGGGYSTDGKTCTKCPAGFYSATPGATSNSTCLPCGEGRFSDEPGAVQCTRCAPGSYSTGMMNTGCELCSGGTFAKEPGSTGCKQCEAGTVAPEDGTGVCEPCEAGWIQPAKGKLTCSKCEAGNSTLGVTGSTECSSCPAGTYSPEDGTPDCIPCPKGSAVNGTENTACVGCVKGFYTGEVGLSACEPCGASTFAATNNATECKPCEPGSANDATGQSTCAECAAGKHQPLAGKAECDLCAIDTYAAVPGAVNCTDCEPGKVTLQTGKTECLQCVVKGMGTCARFVTFSARDSLLTGPALDCTCVVVGQQEELVLTAYTYLKQRVTVGGETGIKVNIIAPGACTMCDPPTSDVVDKQDGLYVIKFTLGEPGEHVVSITHTTGPLGSETGVFRIQASPVQLLSQAWVAAVVSVCVVVAAVVAVASFVTHRRRQHQHVASPDLVRTVSAPSNSRSSNSRSHGGSRRASLKLSASRSRRSVSLSRQMPRKSKYDVLAVPAHNSTTYDSLVMTPVAAATSIAAPAPPRAPPAVDDSTLSLPRDWDVSMSRRRYLLKADEVTREEVIGEGAFGKVYKGVWRSTPVAVKEVKLGALADKARTDLLSEAQKMAELRPHMNVVQFYGACEQPLLVVLQFCNSGALDTALYGEDASKRIDFTEAQQLDLACGIASGLAHLHAEGVVHRDIAARNVLLHREGDTYVPKITDFGMARGDVGGGTRASVQQQTVNRVGPLKWMAPEQMDEGRYSAFSDVWSFGVVLYELYAREAPWQGTAPMEAAHKVMRGEHVPVPSAAPPLVAAVMSECFAREPCDRPPMSTIVMQLTGERTASSKRRHSREVRRRSSKGYGAPPVDLRPGATASGRSATAAAAGNDAYSAPPAKTLGNTVPGLYVDPPRAPPSARDLPDGAVVVDGHVYVGPPTQ